MISKSLLADMHLDPRRIERERKSYESLALAYERWAERQDDKEKKINARSISASLFRRAAAHALMLGDYSEARERERMGARQLFIRAALAYSYLRTPYAILLSAFTNQLPELWERVEYWLNEENLDYGSNLFQPQMTYLLLYYASSVQRKERRPNQNNEVLDIIRRDLEAYRSQPLGILGLRIGSYLDLVDALDSDKNHRNISLEEAAFPFVIEYNNAIRQAMQNEYHWRRLAMPFHPVEPDIFAVLLLVNRAMKATQDQTIVALINNLPLGQESRAFLVGILTDYDEDDATKSIQRKL